ncbi:DUF4238 domain-containing protein [Yinghuangia sp. ASG 101]|uniref:DUF4238 domain-containing protein n=1 Tax=Yinghuangia sp. ASG 101 TaxID=2896848 RepID=UPI001E3A04AC|nr:DUF4238 domain-containing protein [Yinghuangia sp. ASG 101]UGQ10460.1 DUF4238 domain-containing protein [Yinghuangia sp. ASG 101]
MTTNDHTVPQMYLRRFAAHRPGAKGHFTRARHVTAMDKPFLVNVRNVASKKGFHRGVGADGVEHDDTEKIMTRIETAAAPVLSTILDDQRHALIPRWPLRTPERMRLAWLIAAQLLRTKRQRRRVNHLISTAGGETLPAPGNVKSFAANNPHLHYIAENLGVLAAVIHARPWGLGFSSACLATGDTPAVILNGHDAPDQLAAAAYWDIVLPLDPHRVLILPGIGMRDHPAKHNDHRLTLPGGIGLMLPQVAYDAADSQVFQHPDHDPFRLLLPDGPRLPEPDQDTGDGLGPQYLITYDALPPHLTIDRRWVTEHAPRPPATEGPSQPPSMGELNRLSSIIDERRSGAPPDARR